MCCDAGAAAGGGGAGADVQPVPVDGSVDGGVGIERVGAGGDFRAGEDERCAAATAARRSQPCGGSLEAAAAHRLMVKDHHGVTAAILDAVAVAGRDAAGGEGLLAVHVGRAVEQGHAASTHTAAAGFECDNGGSVDLEVALCAAHPVAVGVDSLFGASHHHDTAVVLRVGAVAVDTVVAACVGPHEAAVHLDMVGAVDGVIVGVGLHEAAVDIDAVLALDGLASGVAGGLCAVGGDMSAVDIDIAGALEAFGLAVVGGAATAGPSAATAATAHRCAGGHDVDVNQLIVAPLHADGGDTFDLDATAAGAGALAVDDAGRNGEVAVGGDTCRAVAVGGAAVGVGGAATLSLEGEGAAADGHVAVGRETAAAGVGVGAGHGDIAAVDGERAR